MNSEQWIEYAAAACDDAGIDYGLIEAITTWDQTFAHSDNFRNNAVFRIGDQRCLKIFGPNSERQYHVERSVLGTLGRQELILAPRLMAAGERVDERPYLIMTEIAGESAEHCWNDLSRSEQLAVAREIGVITAVVHGLPQNDLAAVEQQFGGRAQEIEKEQVKRIMEIEGTTGFSVGQRDDLLCFLLGEALEFVDVSPKLNHNDLSHAHVFLAKERGEVMVSGFIDWAEGMLGPPEWDLACHWFWTFSCDREAMRACLQAYFGDARLPERFARRCLATFFYTYSMGLLWPRFVEDPGEIDSIVPDTITAFFPAEVFGPPD